ncbi:MAG: hypothetical protein AAGJ80_18780, partial [Cyanobacteria bacterium J06553_1]
EEECPFVVVGRVKLMVIVVSISILGCEAHVTARFLRVQITKSGMKKQMSSQCPAAGPRERQ